MIDGCFSADGAVRLSQQGNRVMDQRRCRADYVARYKSGKISDDAASESDERRLAVDSTQKKLPCRAYRRGGDFSAARREE